MSVWQHTRGGWYLGVSRPGRKQAKHYLGRVTKGVATWIDARVKELQLCDRLGAPLSPETAGWITGLRGPLRDWLVTLGLAEQPKLAESLTLPDWFDQYLRTRVDYSESTKKGWNTVKKHLISAFGDAQLDQINAFHAVTFSRSLSKKASSEHAAKIIERTRQLFQAAIQAEILTKNPFADIHIQGKPDKSRAFYLQPDIAAAVLAACPHQEAKAVFALARFCGLRVPHEPLALEWSHIDFEKRRISVPDATKTGARVLPLFQPAFECVLQLRAATPTDQIYVIDRARRSAATTWRNWLLEAIAEAGLHGWPKLWHNLRASCRTDMADQFEPHVCDAWLGHSSRVARDHYLMVTDDDWAKAHGNTDARTVTRTVANVDERGQGWSTARELGEHS